MDGLCNDAFLDGKSSSLPQEDLTQFRKMASAPIPVAAVKRRGMESLRDILNDMKVQ